MIPKNHHHTVAQENIIKKDVLGFVKFEFSLMPFFMAIPLMITQNIFLILVYISFRGKTLDQLMSWEQKKVINICTKLGITFYGLFRLYRSLVLLSFFEHEIVKTGLGLPSYKDYQNNKRNQYNSKKLDK